MAARALRVGLPLTALAVMVALGAVCGAACVAVPDLRFVGDAGADDGGPTRDGAGDANGGDGGDGGDGGGSCTDPAPTGGTCCGTVWCLDSCGTTNCSACAAAGCGAGQVCCGKGGSVVCKAKCP